jgi:hypothetical protein
MRLGAVLEPFRIVAQQAADSAAHYPSTHAAPEVGGVKPRRLPLDQTQVAFLMRCRRSCVPH